MLLPWLRKMDPALLRQWQELDELTMGYETAVILLPEQGYREAFFRLYRIKDRTRRLIPASENFRQALREVCGDSVWQPIAEGAEALFGTPRQVLYFEEEEKLREELEGPRGLAPFFFVFGMMFCEYEGFTLCFMSGTNN